jgi:hypothetical protein
MQFLDKGKGFFESMKMLIHQELKKERLLIGEWHNGKVESVISSKLLSVYVDGSTTPQKIPCNPDVTFAAGDEVFVQFINRDTKNKFVPYKRGV